MSGIVYRHCCVMVLTLVRHGPLLKAIEWLVLLLLIRKIAGSNPEMAYHERSFFFFCEFPQLQMHDKKMRRFT